MLVICSLSVQFPEPIWLNHYNNWFKNKWARQMLTQSSRHGFPAAATRRGNWVRPNQYLTALCGRFIFNTSSLKDVQKNKFIGAATLFITSERSWELIKQVWLSKRIFQDLSLVVKMSSPRCHHNTWIFIYGIKNAFRHTFVSYVCHANKDLYTTTLYLWLYL